MTVQEMKESKGTEYKTTGKKQERSRHEEMQGIEGTENGGEEGGERGGKIHENKKATK